MVVRASKLGPGLLKITPEAGEERQFEGQVTGLTWEPEYTLEDPVQVLSGEQYQEPGKLASKISGEVLQDYLDQSLLKWCYDNRGAEADFTFVPSKEGKLQLSGRLMISPVSIGGEPAKTNRASFEFTVIGEPAITEDYVAEESLG